MEKTNNVRVAKETSFSKTATHLVIKTIFRHTAIVPISSLDIFTKDLFPFLITKIIHVHGNVFKEYRRQFSKRQTFSSLYSQISTIKRPWASF